MAERSSGARPAEDVLRAALADGYERLLAAIGQVERDEPDAVHQVRVAARGLRSDARVFRDLLAPEWVTRLRIELAWLAGACAPARDFEIVEAWLDGVPEDAELPLVEADVAQVRAALLSRREAAEEAARAATKSGRARALLADIRAGAHSPPVTDSAAAPAVEVLEPLVRKAWRSYAKAARRLEVDESSDPESADAAWHEVRVRAKRARYVARSASSAVQVEGVEAAAKQAQTHLGEHQDRVVAAVVMAEIGAATDSPAVAFAAGRLAETARRERLPIRAGFRRPSKKPPA